MTDLPKDQAPCEDMPEPTSPTDKFKHDHHNTSVPRSSISPDNKQEISLSEDPHEKVIDPVSRKGKILRGKKLFLAFVGMLMSILLIALDQTILSPALPVIASNFNALDQIGWIASAYVSFGFSILFP